MAGQQKFLDAIDRVIKDDQHKYDECLVDRFLEFVRFESHLVDKLNSYLKPKFFKIANQCRVYKLCYKIMLGSKFMESSLPVLMFQMLDEFWSTIQITFINQDRETINLMLSILHRISCGSHSYIWLMDRRFDPPLEKPGFQIKNVIELARYYMETSKNYHIENRAERLFVSIVKQSFRLHPTSSIVTCSRSTMEELLAKRSTPVYRAIAQILDPEETPVSIFEQLSEKYHLLEMIQKNLDELITNTSNPSNSRDIVSISKCLALLDKSNDVKSTIDKLKAINNLEAIVVYVTNLPNEKLNHSILLYILYPILTKCDSEDAQVLIPKLFGTREERDFIERNINDKVVALSISYLKKVVTKRYNGIGPQYTQQTLVFFLDILLEYVVCNYSSQKSYKNILECFSIFRTLCRMFNMFNRKGEIIWYFHLLDNIHNIMQKIECDSNQNRTMIVQFIKLMSCIQRSSSQLQTDKAELNLLKTIELAFRFNDHEIFNEFAELFKENYFDFSLEPEKVRRYVELVWNHMYSNSKDTEHPDLMKNLVILMRMISCQVDLSVLDGMEAKSFFDNSINLKTLSDLHIRIDDDDETYISPESDSSKERAKSYKLSINSYIDDILSDKISERISECY